MKQLALKTTKAKAAKKEDRVANGGIHRTIKRPHPKFRRVSCLLEASFVITYPNWILFGFILLVV